MPDLQQMFTRFTVKDLRAFIFIQTSLFHIFINAHKQIIHVGNQCMEYNWPRTPQSNPSPLFNVSF